MNSQGYQHLLMLSVSLIYNKNLDVFGPELQVL
jgi:hypothetical protein